MILDDKLMKYVLFKKRTEEEVRQKCRRSEYTDEYTDEIIEYLKENAYINDQIYVEKHINSIMRIKKSSIYEIKIELLKRGIAEEYIEKYISEHEEELQEFEKESAEKIVEKKIRTDEIEKIKRYLKSKGYSYKSISNAIDNNKNIVI